MSSSDSDFDEYFKDPHQRLKDMQTHEIADKPEDISITSQDISIISLDDKPECDTSASVPSKSTKKTSKEVPPSTRKTRGRKPQRRITISDEDTDLDDRISLELAFNELNTPNSLVESLTLLSEEEIEPRPRTRSRKKFTGRNKRPVGASITISDEEIEAKASPKIQKLDQGPNIKKYSILVLWQSEIDKQFELDPNETFSTLFDYYAEKKGQPKDLIVFFTDEKQMIKPNDTPSKLGLFSGGLIDGGLVSKPYLNDLVAPKKSQFEIKLKIQCEHLKRPFFVAIDRNDDFRVLLDKCATELNVSSDLLKLIFDGDPLSLSSTPIIMDFTGGECLDLYCKKA